MRRSRRRNDGDPFRPEPAGRKGLRLTTAAMLLAGAGCCVYFMPVATATTEIPVTLKQAAGVAGALACLAGAALLFAWES